MWSNSLGIKGSWKMFRNKFVIFSNKGMLFRFCKWQLLWVSMTRHFWKGFLTVRVWEWMNTNSPNLISRTNIWNLIQSYLYCRVRKLWKGSPNKKRIPLSWIIRKSHRAKRTSWSILRKASSKKAKYKDT